MKNQPIFHLSQTLKPKKLFLFRLKFLVSSLFYYNLTQSKSD
ncbi:hypothetical protein SAMN02745753_02201 [Marinomonas polaris DSM 16579]|uniref:Uncharacterized protein n=1 Tax=Marinomonas polaris DSM 16579 TaxID=1122206 RepID=A0A1M5CPB3_9GAMM|nr:hypothetical protein SAMN02745753_02201 [Marinomonas polaris DSM 16579]